MFGAWWRDRRTASLIVGSLIAVGVLAVPASAAAPTGPAGPVLPAASASAATAPLPASVAAAIEGPLSSGALGSSVGAVVIDVATGDVVYDLDGAQPKSTASNEKVFTAVSILSALGPDHRIVTTVTYDKATSALTIVGAGDPTLASVAADGSSLADLADQVSAQVDGGTPIVLRYDTSLFSGPAIAPGWDPSYPELGVAAPVSALIVDRARVPGLGARERDPALAAATLFAALLAERGLSVDEPQPGSAVGSVIATTESVPLATMVETMLTESDNDMAEQLAHLAGAELTGTGSFESGALATKAALDALGIPTTGLTSTDGSGLSYDDQASPLTLASVMAAVAGQASPSWSWPIITGLPIAGLTGTLNDRFFDASAADGAGVVRAKTGTLAGVTTLAGTVVDADGRLLVFAFMSDESGDVYSARAALDSAAAALAVCSCSG